MNKERRKRIEEAGELLNQAAEILRESADEEQEYYDNAPENMMYSEKYERAEEVAGQLSEHADTAEELAAELEDCLY